MINTGYTKLFSSIVNSTIWQESKETKLVWITMLALANKDGEVAASVPGLARMAGVEIAECEEALGRLKAPDPYSRSREHEGRRIEEIDGGWLLLNHAKYRNAMSKEDRREYLRVKQAEYRKLKSQRKRGAEVEGRTQAVIERVDEANRDAAATHRSPVGTNNGQGLAGASQGGVRLGREEDQEGETIF